MNHCREEEEIKIIKNAMDEIDIGDAKRLRLEYNRLCENGELGSLSHGRKRKLREANALCQKYKRLKEKLTMLVGTYVLEFDVAWE